MLSLKYDDMNDAIHRILEFTIGNIFGKDITCREPVHHCDEYQPGSLVELGRTIIKVWKRYNSFFTNLFSYFNVKIFIIVYIEKI